MKTTANRDLFAYWNSRRAGRIAPARSDIEPNAIRHVLGDSFFLAADGAGNYPFRLAGTRLCALFGRELKSDSFFNMWGASDQPTLRKLMNVVTDEKVGVVAQATGRTNAGATLIVNLELLLLPLAEHGPHDARVLGAFVPIAVPFWLGARFVGPLELGALRHIGPEVDQIPAPQLVPAMRPPQARRDGLIRHGFVVYQGGRTD